MKISIITVCLNSEKTIKYTLNSVMSQNYHNIEHIIVDGGSTDNTLKILKNYKFKNKRVFFLKNNITGSNFRSVYCCTSANRHEGLLIHSF